MALVRSCLLAIALSVCGYAFSSQEAGNNKSIAQKKKQARDEGQQSAPNPTNSAKAKADEPKNASDKGGTYSDEKTKLDRELVDYTGELSKFTFWLVIATAVLGIIGIGQGYFSLRQLLFSHPPNIVVRRFQYRPQTRDREAGLEFVVTNTGYATATIVADVLTIKILGQTEMPWLEENSFPRYEHGATNALSKRQYKPTERQAQFIPFRGLVDLKSALDALEEGGAGIACFGLIRYRDVLRNVRETRFFRTYKRGELLMLKHPDSDYDDSGDNDKCAERR